MRRLLLWILMVTTLLAQSAWAFEGHAGQFESSGSHQQAPAHPDAPSSDEQAPAAKSHCAHCPVHFVAVHREHLLVAGHLVGGDLPAYRAPVSSLHADPPTQPPRS